MSEQDALTEKNKVKINGAPFVVIFKVVVNPKLFVHR